MAGLFGWLTANDLIVYYICKASKKASGGAYMLDLGSKSIQKKENKLKLMRGKGTEKRRENKIKLGVRA